MKLSHLVENVKMKEFAMFFDLKQQEALKAKFTKEIKSIGAEIDAKTTSVIEGYYDENNAEIDKAIRSMIAKLRNGSYVS